MSMPILRMVKVKQHGVILTNKLIGKYNLQKTHKNIKNKK